LAKRFVQHYVAVDHGMGNSFTLSTW